LEPGGWIKRRLGGEPDWLLIGPRLPPELGYFTEAEPLPPCSCRSSV